MDPRSLKYLTSTPRIQSPLPALIALGQELAAQIPVGQLRSLLYQAGRRFGVEHPIGDIRTLGDFEIYAQGLFQALDWGWVEIQESPGAVDIVHGCSPILGWFGPDAAEWAPGFFEGVYAEWMRQLGAGDRLDVREVISNRSSSDYLVFRLAHESNFAEVES